MKLAMSATALATISLVDAQSSEVLQSSIINGRLYFEGIKGQEVYICLNFHQNEAQKYVTASHTLAVSCLFDGKRSHSVHYLRDIKTGKTIRYIKYVDTAAGRQAITLHEPELIPFEDKDDEKAHVERNQNPSVGKIEVEIWYYKRGQKTPKSTSKIRSPQAVEEKSIVPGTKKFFNRPNLGINGGRIVEYQPSEFHKNHTKVRLLETLTCYVQTAVVCMALRMAEPSDEKPRLVVDTAIGGNQDSTFDAIIYDTHKRKKDADVVDLSAIQDESRKVRAKAATTPSRSVVIDLT